jgi:hypothetical protein
MAGTPAVDKFTISKRRRVFLHKISKGRVLLLVVVCGREGAK